jgi:hypothetical protein
MNEIMIEGKITEKVIEFEYLGNKILEYTKDMEHNL